MKGYLFSQNWDMKGPGFVRNLMNLNSHTFLGLVHTTPEEFESGVFALKTHQIFSVQTTPKEVKTQKSPAILDLRFRKIRSGKSHEKLRFQKCFPSTRKRKPGVFKFLEERFQKRSVLVTD